MDKNSRFAGGLPGLRKPGDDDYYLRRNLQGKYSVAGCLYTQAKYNGDDFSFFLMNIITKFTVGVDRKPIKTITGRDRITFKYDIINGRKKPFGFIYVMKTVFI